MNKITRIFLITMCAGVLLTGIGAGIAFGEYSSMELREIETSESGQPVTANADLAIPDKGDVNIYTPAADSCTIVEDETLEPGTVRIEAQSSGLADEMIIEQPYVSTFESQLYSDENGQLKSVTETITYIHVYPVSSQSGFEVFMRYKDQVLDGLKNGYIYIHPGYYTGFAAQISVNPVDSERIHLL